MKDYKFLKFLKEKKIADSYQYYEACSYKIYLAGLSFSALKNVVSDYQKEETVIIKSVYKDAVTKGKGTYSAHTSSVNYLGIDVSPTVIMDKLIMEIMSLLHNFFDTFAQWLNASLFAEDGLAMEKVSLTKVVRKMSQFSEYTGQFIDDVVELPLNPDYLYIADYNNTLKHRHQIYVENKFDILAIQGRVSVPKFEKDGRPHIREDALDVLQKKISFCNGVLDSSRTYIESYFKKADNQHVSHRFYNPKTHLFFENEEDCKAMRSPINHYYYIEVDRADLLDSYHFLLVCDQMDGSPDETIEVFNSPYPIIMLREKDTEKFIGILKPNDNISISIKDEKEIYYRRYIPQTIGYEYEMYMAICQAEPFHYYPYLSYVTKGYNLPE
ncbi:hypothetical protein [Blautia wexlerae]|uniref:hypothetical protein n=1 Tax=Blautia wexlerae TaxID=418240 RepID=UPI0035BEAF16